MKQSIFRKPYLFWLTMLLGLIIVGVTTVYMGTRWVQARIVQMLQPYGQAERVYVRFSAVVIENLTLQAASHGPDISPARASKVVLEPDWHALLARRLVLRTVTIDGFTLPVYRTADGKLQILPALTAQIKNETHDRDPSPSKLVVKVEKIGLTHGTLDFIDAAIAKPAHKITLEQVQATIGPCQFPQGSERTAVDLSAQMPGRHKKGAVFIKGWFVPVSKDTDMQIRLNDIDVPRVAPYLRKDTSTSLVDGLMGLTMHLRIKQQHLDAQGNIMLSDLQFNDQALLLSLPRKVVLAALKNHQGKVSFNFSVQGQLNDPKFALDDSIAAHVAGGLANAIGVSVRGAAEGATDIIKGLGGAFTDLLGR